MRQLTISHDTLLDPVLRNMWVLEKNLSSFATESIRFFPDGYVGLMYSECSGSLFMNEKTLPDLFFYGQTVKPINITANGSYRIIVSVIEPHMVKSITGLDASELTDSCIDIQEICQDSVNPVVEQLRLCQSNSQRIHILKSLLLKLADRNMRYYDDTVRYAVSQLIQTNGSCSLKDLSQYLKVSDRTLERKFDQHVGVSPRLFGRICRFKSSLDQLNDHQFENLSDIAYDQGFADHSHYIRNFKEFAGLLPKQYVNQSQGIYHVI